MKRRQQWITNIRRLELDPTKIHFICEAHFAVEMWEKPRIDAKKMLKNTAVPTIFKHKSNQNITASIDSNNIGSASLNTENNMKATNHEDLSDNIVVEEIKSLFEDTDESCILLIGNIQNEDVEKTMK